MKYLHARVNVHKTANITKIPNFMFFNSTKRTLKQIDEEKIKLGYPTLLYLDSFLSNNKSTRFFTFFFLSSMQCLPMRNLDYLWGFQVKTLRCIYIGVWKLILDAACVNDNLTHIYIKLVDRNKEQLTC